MIGWDHVFKDTVRSLSAISLLPWEPWDWIPVFLHLGRLLPSSMADCSKCKHPELNSTLVIGYRLGLFIRFVRFLERGRYFQNSICSQIKEHKVWASLVAQWLRIHLPMQGTRVRALVREDPTCRGATKPMHHNYWAWPLEPVNHNDRAHAPQLLKPVRLEPVLCNKRSHRNEKPVHHNEE